MSIVVGSGTVEQAEQAEQAELKFFVKMLSHAFEPIFLEPCAFSLFQVFLVVAVPIYPEVSVLVVMEVRVMFAVLFDRGHHLLWVPVPVQPFDSGQPGEMIPPGSPVGVWPGVDLSRNHAVFPSVSF